MDNVYEGSKVVIKASVMQPRGWPRYPKSKKQQIDVPDGTAGTVISIDASRTMRVIEVDYVLEDKLYRTAFEAQYVRAVKVTR